MHLLPVRCEKDRQVACCLCWYHIEKENRAFFNSNDIVLQRAAVWHNVGFSKQISWADLIQDV